MEVIIMKRMTALLLTVLLLLTLTACAGGSDPTDVPDDRYDPEPGVDYTPAESPVITDEIRTLVDKAAQNLDGADYEPYAYVASQVVAGTNHLILCKVTPVVPDAVTAYALVTVYEDLNGSAEITSVLDSTITAPALSDEDYPTAGGYAEPDSPVVTDEVKSALVKACETLTGAEYEPVALLASQVVAGMNYKLLCRATPSVVLSDPEVYYTIVTVYADLSGNAEITDVYDFDAE